MHQKIFKFECPEYYNLYMTCHAHGWKNLAPFSWDGNDNLLRFSALTNDQPVDFLIEQSKATIRATTISRLKLSPKSLRNVKSIITRTLSLDIDIKELLEKAEKIGVEYVNLLKKGAGRLLRAPSLWEDAAKTLFTTNCSWALTKKLCKTACSKDFSDTTPSMSYPFPAPQKFTNYTPEEIRKLMPIGYRAGSFLELAKRFSYDPYLSNIELNGFGYKQAETHVIKLRGFGQYATKHLLVLSGYYDEIPIDTVVISYLKKNYRVRKPGSFIKRKYAKWGKYRWWGFKLEKMLNQQNWLGN